MYFAPLPAAKLHHLQDANREVRPHIIHFSGHGTSSSELLIKNRQEVTVPLLVDGLVMLMTRYGEASGRLAVLLYCHSRDAAKAIIDDPSCKIACAIGMDGRIDDDAAIEFAAAFYGELRFGSSVERAFQAGLTEVAMGVPGQARVPKIFSREGVDRQNLALVPPLDEALSILPDLGARDAFVVQATTSITLILYHAPWSAHSRDQLGVLRELLPSLRGSARVASLEVTDANTSALWAQNIRAFPTLEIHRPSGQTETLSGYTPGDRLRATLERLP